MPATVMVMKLLDLMALMNMTKCRKVGILMIGMISAMQLTIEYNGQDITGNEVDSVLRRLGDCFADGYRGVWAGFYNQGYPAFQQHRRMFWHLKHRVADDDHKESWHRDCQEDITTEHIRRHKNESIFSILVDFKRSTEYGCSDPRLHPRSREQVNKRVEDSTRRHQQDFEEMEHLITDYIEQHGCIPYCIFLQILAMRYLGAGLLEVDYADDEYPYLRFKSILMHVLESW